MRGGENKSEYEVRPEETRERERSVTEGESKREEDTRERTRREREKCYRGR